ncbi:flotillin-like protein 3 [Lycium ferocissimum]|uniref:flotillin-like protein 3 n=1 Tax=Lycium ferocissimum TaxID=112874 RepID=UPI00281583BB|nr:flotillin-like protein 3 [Lycium ferocissimum]
MGFPKYVVARPSEMLAITGSGISEILLKKKHFVLPFQKCTRLNISPVNYSFQVQAMSAEKLPFCLPAVFTIGPKVLDENHYESLIKYAKLVSNSDKESTHIQDLVKGIIEGETRVLAASMTMEQIFKGAKEFKKEVFEKVQLELNQFGLYIYNANVKQLVDVPGHEYFSYLGQKTQMDAANQAKIDVAEARMKGEIGAKLREGETKQNAAKIDAETVIMSTKRQGESKKEQVKVRTEVEIFEKQREAEVAEANALLAKKKAGWSQTARLAEVEAEKAVAIREAELQMEVEKKKAFAQTAKLKADLLSKANVEYDIKVQETNAQLYRRQKEAEAGLFESQKKAEAQKANADAELYTRQQNTNSELYAKQKEAEGVAAIGKAEATYLGSILKELNHNYSALRDYMMINNGIYQDIAKINAQAVNGMQPKISIWSGANGECDGEGGSGLKDVASVYRMLPPLLQTVHEQTGMQPPAWLGTLPESK